MKRILTGTLTAGAVVAATSFGLLVSSPASLAGGVPSSAYGVQAAGPVPIEPTPYVESSGATEEMTAVELPAESPVQGKVVSLSATGDTANVHLADLRASNEQLDGVLAEVPELPPELKTACQDLAEGAAPAEEQLAPVKEQLATNLQDLSLEDLCPLAEFDPAAVLEISALQVWCSGDEGGMTITNLDVLGQPVNFPPPAPNTTLVPETPLDAAVKVTLNQQVENADGSFTVNGVVIDIGGGEEVITLGSTTCGEQVKSTIVKDPAPEPTPVPTHHPVTG